MNRTSIGEFKLIGESGLFSLRLEEIFPRRVFIKGEDFDPFERTIEIPMPDFNQGEAE